MEEIGGTFEIVSAPGRGTANHVHRAVVKIENNKTMSIRVAIVEDDCSVRENLAKLVDGTAGFSCVAGCASAEEAWQQLPPLAPDVVLMDIHLPGRSGIACVERLRKLLPEHAGHHADNRGGQRAGV